MSARQAIADAASTLDVIDVTPTYRQSTKVGTGFVRLAQVVLAENELDYIGTFDVHIHAPQDLAEAEKWIATHEAAIVTALSTAMHVQSWEPQSVVYPDATNLNDLVITGTRAIEQE